MSLRLWQLRYAVKIASHRGTMYFTFPQLARATGAGRSGLPFLVMITCMTCGIAFINLGSDQQWGGKSLFDLVPQLMLYSAILMLGAAIIRFVILSITPKQLRELAIDSVDEVPDLANCLDLLRSHEVEFGDFVVQDGSLASGNGPVNAILVCERLTIAELISRNQLLSRDVLICVEKRFGIVAERHLRERSSSEKALPTFLIHDASAHGDQMLIRIKTALEGMAVSSPVYDLGVSQDDVFGRRKLPYLDEDSYGSIIPVDLLYPKELGHVVNVAMTMRGPIADQLVSRRKAG